MKKGDKFLCTQDAVVDEFEIIFQKGKLYISEENGTLPNIYGDNDPEWQDKSKWGWYWPKYFKQIHEEESE